MRFILIKTPIILFLLFCIGTQVSGQTPGYASYTAGEGLRRQNNCSQAIQKYDEAIKLEPGNYRYYFAKGKCYSKLNQDDQALTAYLQCVEFKPDYTSAYTLIARLYQKKKEYDNAVSYYNLAFLNEKDPGKKLNYKLNAVKLQLMQNKVAEANANIQDAKAIAPADKNVLFYDGEINLAMENWESAKQSYLKASDMVKDEPPATSAKYFYGLGLAYFKLGDNENAKKAWEKANFGPYKAKISGLMSKSSHTYFYSMAISYYQGGDIETALANLNKSVEIQNNFSPAYKLMGIIANKRGQNTHAVANLQKAIDFEQDPAKKASIYGLLVSIYLDREDYSGALAAASNVLATQPTNVKIMQMKAKAEFNLGKYESAIITCENAVAAITNDPAKKAPFYLIMGMAARKSGKNDRAKEALKSASVGVYKYAAKNELDLANGKTGAN